MSSPSQRQVQKPVLHKIAARNFRSLHDVSVEFGRFSVLVGPNGSGKSNLLHVLRFIRDTAQFDLVQAINEHGGYDRLHRASRDASQIELEITAQVTRFATTRAADRYLLTLEQHDDQIVRTETFLHKRTSGQGRRYGFFAEGGIARVGETNAGGNGRVRDDAQVISLTEESTSALSAFSRVSTDQLQDGPNQFVRFLSSIRYLDPAVTEARRPSRLSDYRVDDNASNLSGTLKRIHDEDPDAFQALVRDIRECLPGLNGIDFTLVSGDSRAVVTVLDEAGLDRPIELADASFGTVRLLALLAALHDPDPPLLTIIEEVDHGLHPYALDVLVDRMRVASRRTQIIAASHSPTLVNRLQADEVIICGRDVESGVSIIPAAYPSEIADAVARSGLGIGELWYSGALGGVPE